MLTHLAGPDSRPSRVLILGRSGFVAKYLIAELEKSRTPVKALGRPELDLTAPSSVETLSDLVQPEDTVVILSALTPDKGRDFRTLMKNLRMAEHLCEVFDRRPCAHVVYVSSDAVYDGRAIPIDEDSSREPVDLYALMHTGREMMLESVLASHNVPLCILRLVALFGLGDTHKSYGPNRFVLEAFDARTITLFGKGEDQRTHLYIRDAVRLLAECVTRVSTGTLNLAHPEAMSFVQVAEFVRASLPFPAELKFKEAPHSTKQTSISQRPFDVHGLHDAFGHFEFTAMADAVADFVAAYSETRRRGQPPAIGA